MVGKARVRRCKREKAKKKKKRQRQNQRQSGDDKKSY